MEHSFEVLSTVGRRGGGRRNRRWPDAEKARIVAETLEPNATVGAVARRHGLQAHHLSSWRSLARNGKLVLPAVAGEIGFVPVVVAEAAAAVPVQAAKHIDILYGSVTIRLEANVLATRLAAIVHALNAAP